MRKMFKRAAGLHVHKDQVTASVRCAGKRDEEEIHEFGTTTRELLALADWLAAHRVELVVMEATGVYWRPVVRREAS